MDEIWKNIKGYEGFYAVSNMGRVKSLPRKIMRKDKKPLEVKEKILCGSKDTKGYIQVELRKDGRRNIKVVHRLVAEAFIYNAYEKPQVNHKDGNKENNCVENLEWCSCRENVRHAWNNNLQKPLVGENHGNHKLNNEAVLYIRKHYKPRDRQFGINALARKFGVTSYPVARIVNGKGWRHVK